MLARLVSEPKRVPATLQKPPRDKERRHHVDWARVESEVPGDVVDRTGVAVEPGEQIEPLERRDEHVNGVELVAASIKESGICPGSVGQVTHVRDDANPISAGGRCRIDRPWP